VTTQGLLGAVQKARSRLIEASCHDDSLLRFSRAQAACSTLRIVSAKEPVLACVIS
jgi:hypothetical protein